MSSTARHSVRFGTALIDTTVTSDAAVADEWVRRVCAAAAAGDLVVGLDCEWSTTKVAVLQLCVGTSCLILQLLHSGGIPASIRSFLGDRAVRCVGVGVGEDAAKLAGDHGLVCASPVDLQDICNGQLGRPSSTNLGLAGYAKEVLGLTVEKHADVVRSNWEKRELDVAQIQYACVDAYVSYKLGERVLQH